MAGVEAAARMWSLAWELPHVMSVAEKGKKSIDRINAGEGVEKKEPTYTLGGNSNRAATELAQPLWRTVWRFLKN